MQTTEAEVNLAIMEWQSKYKPLWFAETENNLRLMYAALRNRVLSRAPIDAEKIRDIVENFNKYGQSNGVTGRLDVVQTSVASTDALNEVPWAEEPLLRTVISMSVVRQMTSTQLKMVSSLYPYDASGNTIVPVGKKFEERVAWLKANPDVDPSAVAEAIERVLGKTPSEKPQDSQEGGVRCLTNDGREKAIRDRILQESRNNRTFFTPYAQKKFDKLNAYLNELLTDQSKRVFRDRSKGGGGELLSGWAAVEALMEQKFRDYESPWH